MNETVAESLALRRQNAELAGQLAALERKMRVEKAKCASILRCVADAIVLTDGERGIEFVNEAFVLLTGYGAQEVLGRPFDLLLAPATSDLLREAIQGALASGTAWQGGVRMRRKDGREYDAALTIAAAGECEKGGVSCVSTHHDISRFSEFESARRQFMTHISHELRTPVANIKLYAQLLRREPPADKMRRYCQVLDEQSDRLGRLTQDIIEMAALDGGQAVRQWELVSLGKILSGLQQRFASLAGRVQVSLVVQAIPDGIQIRCDPERLTQALGELVENALVYSPAGGRVTLAVDLRERPDGTWIVVRVSDSGPGIPQEEQDQVFERFFRGRAAGGGDVPGSGLGLSIAQQIVRAHGGRVTLESHSGAGSNFLVWLRAA